MDLMGSTITLASVITIGMFVLGVLTFISNRSRNTKKDSEEDRKKAGEQEARMVRIETMLVKIDENTSDLKQKVDSHDKLLTKHESKINVLEERLKAKGGK